MTRTAAQSRAEAKVEYNAFFATCPSRQLLARISDKWVVLILCALGGDGAAEPGVARPAAALRYSEIARRLVGVSQKMLTQNLRALERDGLLVRTVTPTVPVTVSYELTDLGLSLHRLAGGIRSWAQGNMTEVLANRQEYDVRTA
jgi:DNA-binding HxlR family transcriptional regulator